MTIEELKQLYGDGKLTWAQFVDLAKKQDPDFEPGEEPKAEPDQAPPEGALSEEAVAAMIKSAEDRVRKELGTANAGLRETIEKLKREKLTDEERRALEAEEQGRKLAERERVVAEAENRMYAIKAIKAAGLDDGSEASLELIALVMAGDAGGIDGNVKALKVQVERLVKDKVDKLFKDAGGTPPKGGDGGGGGANPFAKETWNLTEQMRLLKDEPEKAAALQGAAGK